MACFVDADLNDRMKDVWRTFDGLIEPRYRTIGSGDMVAWSSGWGDGVPGIAACPVVRLANALVDDLRRDRLLDEGEGFKFHAHCRQSATPSAAAPEASAATIQPASVSYLPGGAPSRLHIDTAAPWYSTKVCLSGVLFVCVERQVKTLRGRAPRVRWRGACQDRGRR
jgi:hypothetical protein